MAAASTSRKRGSTKAAEPTEPTNGDLTPEQIEEKVKAEQEQKRLDALKDDSRKVGPNGGSMKRESSAPKKPRASAFVAAEKVLRDADGPMSVDDILAEVKRRKLYTFSDAPTPPKTRMYVQLHAGIAKGKTVKVGRGKFDVADLNPKGAEKRPTKKAEGRDR